MSPPSLVQCWCAPFNCVANGATFQTVSMSFVHAVRQCYWSPIAVLRHLSVQAVCLQDLGVWTDRVCLKQRRLFPNTQFDVLTAVRHCYCTQFLSIHTALRKTLQLVGYVRHHCITARALCFCSVGIRKQRTISALLLL